MFLFHFVDETDPVSFDSSRKHGFRKICQNYHFHLEIIGIFAARKQLNMSQIVKRLVYSSDAQVTYSF